MVFRRGEFLQFQKSERSGLKMIKVVLPIVMTFIIAFIMGIYVYASQVKEVEINLKGKCIKVKTMGRTVGDVIRENGIELKTGDIVIPGLDQNLKAVNFIDIKDMPLQVMNLESMNRSKKTNYVVEGKNPLLKEKKNYVEKIVTVKVKVPYEKKKIPDKRMRKGEVKIVRAGKFGLAERTYKVVYRNGKEVSRKFLDEKIIQQPIDQVERHGTLAVVTTSRGDVLRYRKCLIMTATAYDASYESTGKYPGHPEYGITATGIKARRGIVAVDPRVIPLGTRLYIESLQNNVPNYGYAIAADTGGAIKGNIIDLFFETRREVDNWGIRKVRVYILE